MFKLNFTVYSVVVFIFTVEKQTNSLTIKLIINFAFHMHQFAL